MSTHTLCECGHPRVEHLRGGSGVCTHDSTSLTRPTCKCRAFGVARICPGCGGDGIDYAVTSRRRQLAAREVRLFSETPNRDGKVTSRCVSEIPGITPVANPLIEAIRRLESRVSQGCRLDYDIHTYVAHKEGDGPLTDRETPTALPDLARAAYGLWPDEMCQRCYGTGRGPARHFPALTRRVDEMDALLVRAKDSTGSIEGGAKC